jgi:hypothetical protein
MKLDGNRKFYVVILSLIFNALLSAMVIWFLPDHAVPLIGVIGANLTAVNTPFMVSNYGENKVKAQNGDSRNGKTKL